MMAPIIAIIGWKNSGKTTLTERIITELSMRDLRVTSLKHAHHAFDIDHEGTDSFRHRKAGALTTILASSHRIAMMRELGEKDVPSLNELRRMLPQSDITVAEGFKRASIPKIALWDGVNTEQAMQWIEDPHVTALVSRSGTQHATELPQFQADDISAIADHTLKTLSIAL